MLKKIFSLSLCLSLLGIGVSPSFKAESLKSNSQSVTSSKTIKDKKTNSKDYDKKYETLTKEYETLSKKYKNLKDEYINPKPAKKDRTFLARFNRILSRSIYGSMLYRAINYGQVSSTSSDVFGLTWAILMELFY